MVIKFFVIKLFLTLDDRQLRSAVCVFSNKCAHRIFRCLSSSHPARKWLIINLKFCRNIYSTVLCKNHCKSTNHTIRFVLVVKTESKASRAGVYMALPCFF